MPAPGEMFAGRFHVDATIALGGFGIVYRARNVRTGQPCALKVLTPDALFDDDARLRFLEEARRTPSDRSEHVVRVYDADVSDGVPWLSMELLDGGTLHDWISARGPLSPRDFARFFSQLCHGVGAAHERGVVHRDLKPANVFLHRRGDTAGGWSVKVLDFGVAKALGVRGASETASIAVRTDGWGAPEQAIGGSISPAADVWALGLLAYFALTGRGYFSDVALGEVLVPASVRARGQGVADRLPPGFDAWFARCVAWDPKARLGDALAALEAFPFERAAPPRRARHAPWAIAVLALTAGLVATGWWIGHRIPTPEAPEAPEAPDAMRAFVDAWLAAITAPPVTRARLSSFYSDTVRFNGERRGAAWVADYWQEYFTGRGGSFRQTAPLTATVERLSPTHDAAALCGADRDVTLLRLSMEQDEPGRAVRTARRVPCARLHGTYLLRLRETPDGPRICHESWHERDGICASCPAAQVCVRRGRGDPAR